MKTKKILFVTILPFHKVGNQSLINTIKGYYEKGYDVSLIANTRIIFHLNNTNICQINYKNPRSRNNKIYEKESLADYSLDYKNEYDKIFYKELEFISTNKYYLVKDILLYFIFQLYLLVTFLRCPNILKCDILYAYGVHSVPILKVLSKLTNKKLVTRFQGTILYGFLKNKKVPIYLFHHRFSLKIPADLLVMANDGTNGYRVLKMLKNKSNKILFIPNGVDERRRKINVYKDKNKIVFLTCNRLTFWKRIDRVIIVVNELVKTYNKNIQCYIIGEGALYDDLKKMIEYFELGDYINLLKGVNFEELNRYYSVADYYITLNDQSNLTNGLLESIKLDIPVITFKERAIEEICDLKYSFNKNDDFKKQIAKLNEYLETDKKIPALKYVSYWKERMVKEISYLEKNV